MALTSAPHSFVISCVLCCILAGKEEKIFAVCLTKTHISNKVAQRGEEWSSQVIVKLNCLVFFLEHVSIRLLSGLSSMK